MPATTSSESRFYVYAYLREDGTPYYIGKGTRRRAWVRPKTDRVKAPTDQGRIRILLPGLTSADALEAEVDLISLLGVKADGGCLINLTAGGDGLTDPGPEVREKMSRWTRTGDMKQKMSDTKCYLAWQKRWADLGITYEQYSELTRKQRYNLYVFIQKYPELSAVQAYGLGADGRRDYAAHTVQAKQARQLGRRASGVNEKVAQATKKRAAVYCWFHPEHGTHTCAIWELAERFPEQRLVRPNLSKVVRGERSKAQGWSLANVEAA